ncbi:MAG: PD40 domain-containing protein, partial [Acidobacteria bacterium]|nr:PD40 domain-containing protein [Acidobacteriota bacterium]
AQQRPKDAGDVRLEIDDARAAASVTVSQTVVAPVAAPTPTPRRWLLLAALACLIVAALTGIAVWILKPAPAAPPRPVERLAIPLPPNATLGQTTSDLVALSPDGSHLAYAAGRSGSPPQLYLRAMDALEATPLAGTENAASPFFSPDGQWIGFFSGQYLKKISVSGGAALTLARATGSPQGAAWGLDDTIIFAGTNSSGLMKVSAAGGEPQPFSTLQPGEASHRWPQFLPDGKAVIFTAGLGGSFDDAQIAVQRLDSREQKILVRGGTYARYVPTGHLVYYRAGSMMAVPFDPAGLEVKVAPAPVVEGVMANPGTGAAQFSLSNLGSLAYISGTPQSANVNLVWVDRHGTSQPLPAPARNYRAPKLSPDGRQVAVDIGTDVWIYDIPHDTLTRFTFEGSNASTAAAWTPDGKRIVFPSNKGGGAPNLFWKPADGSGPEERLTTSQNTQRVGSFSPDGRTEIYSEVDPKTGQDLWVLTMDGDRKPRVFLQTPFNESSAQISPDGHWLAYASDESGRLEVYVRPFPEPGGKWQVSTDGGSEIAWSHKGNELFYRTGGQKEKMMAVDVQTQPTFSAGKPRLLFDEPYVANPLTSAGALYSVSPDGQRFLMTKAVVQPQAALTQINVVLNWFEELKQKVPVKQ